MIKICQLESGLRQLSLTRTRLPRPRIFAGFFLLWSALIPSAGFASDHPGNIFVQGEEVNAPIPPDWGELNWKAIDIDGKTVGTGVAKDSVVHLGKLPVGYFEVHQATGNGRFTLGVIAKSTAVDDTPIALDTAMSWFYQDPQQIKDACTLCQLAGVKWIRERSSWPELEPSRGNWAPDGRYERAMRIEHEAGLNVLEVNHASPPWASNNGAHFANDLRDVHDFYQGLAKRWKGLADAIEPWNEPDIIEFGGHTGCEIASFQKAAYLGLKAGDPDLLINDTVFAIDRAETLQEFGANEVFPYFDRYDLHHYPQLQYYPRLYGRHRAVSGGRPMWTTEFNLTVHWADEKTKEPSEDELRVQGFRVGKVFSEALYEGPEKAFYFILGDYVERNLQYGLLHQNFTPRPAFLSFAAVGRLMNGAKPIGKVDLGNDKVMGYLFATTVDGTERETLVAWSETKPTTVEVSAAEKMYDYLGRELPDQKKIELTRSTVFMLLPRGGEKDLKIVPPPAKAPWVEGKASPVVLQLLGQTDFKQSGFLIDKSKQLRLVAYNFGSSEARGKLTAVGADDAAGDLTIEPGGRVEKTIHVAGPGNVSVRFEPDNGEHAIVAARLVNAPTTQPK